MTKRIVKTAIALAVASIIVGCGESTSTETGAQFGQQDRVVDNTFNETALLTSLVDKVIVPTYLEFAQNALALQNAIDNYCGALSSQTDASGDLVNAQASWQTAMTTWQLAEMMQIGPLLENGSNLRNKIYSWPNVSSCAVDQDVVNAEAQDYDIRLRTSSRKGLDALEYTLFNTNLNHSCTAFGTAPDGWNNRPDDARMIARCHYSLIAANDLVENANVLVDAWQGSEGYGEILKNAGQQLSDFTSALEAVNDVSDSMFYLTEVTKDAKLATPVGLFANDCGLSPCVENAESVYSDHSLQNIIANLKAFQTLFFGGSEADVGFDDFLVEEGDAETAEKMKQDLAAAISFAESLNSSYETLLSEQADQVEALHENVKTVTDTLKTDFIQSLALELPATSAGDND